MAEQPATRIDAHFIAAGKYHDIDYPRLEILKLLAEHPQIRTTVAADYSRLERLEQCRFLITYTCDLMPTPEQAAQLKAWMENGGKWMALHGTNSILVFTADGLVDAPDDRPTSWRCSARNSSLIRRSACSRSRWSITNMNSRKA